jgi:hypothetical protein
VIARWVPKKNRARTAIASAAAAETRIWLSDIVDLLNPSVVSHDGAEIGTKLTLDTEPEIMWTLDFGSASDKPLR